MIALAGDPPPFLQFPYSPNFGPYWPVHPDIGHVDPKVLEVALVGFEEVYIVGVFWWMWDARAAGVKAWRAYRRWCRTNLYRDAPKPRGSDLHIRITSRKVDEYKAPWWDE